MQAEHNVGEPIAVGVRLRDYGFLVEGCREIGADMHRISKLVTWGNMAVIAGNPLLDAVEGVIADLQKPTS